MFHNITMRMRRILNVALSSAPPPSPHHATTPLTLVLDVVVALGADDLALEAQPLHRRVPTALLADQLE